MTSREVGLQRQPMVELHTPPLPPTDEVFVELIELIMDVDRADHGC